MLKMELFLSLYILPLLGHITFLTPSKISITLVFVKKSTAPFGAHDTHFGAHKFFKLIIFDETNCIQFILCTRVYGYFLKNIHKRLYNTCIIFVDRRACCIVHTRFARVARKSLSKKLKMFI